MKKFLDRIVAGRELGEYLPAYAGRKDVVVLALPRGGVPVGIEVAKALKAPLDIFLVRKLGVPDYEELALGAIASGGVCVMNEEIVVGSGVTELEISEVVAWEQRELKRRERMYRGDRPHRDLKGVTVILVDDGLATGASMRAAVSAVRTRRPARIVVAVPTASPEACALIKKEADEIVCVITPKPFFAVGAWYDDFSQTSDEEVCRLLKEMEELVSSDKSHKVAARSHATKRSVDSSDQTHAG